MGLADRPGFGRYHEVLNRARWDARDVARRWLSLAVMLPVPFAGRRWATETTCVNVSGIWRAADRRK
jgi:hypothetical protein